MFKLFDVFSLVQLLIAVSLAGFNKQNCKLII
jgi:hypothetical protein